jgi:integrase
MQKNFVRKNEEVRLGESTLLHVCQRLVPDGAVPHGFRSTFNDWASDCLDVPEEIVEFSLAHVKKGVAGRYRRKTAIDKRRTLMAQWAEFCAGNNTDNVVPPRRSA